MKIISKTYFNNRFNKKITKVGLNVQQKFFGAKIFNETKNFRKLTAYPEFYGLLYKNNLQRKENGKTKMDIFYLSGSYMMKLFILLYLVSSLILYQKNFVLYVFSLKKFVINFFFFSSLY